MFGFGKKTCTLCGPAVPARDVMRAPDRMNGLVCRSCYAQWERSGRTCAERKTKVAGMQDVGAFFEQRGLGHADCGGVRLFS